MGFVEDEQKSLVEGMKAKSAAIEQQRRKNKRIIAILLPLVILGGAFVIYDFVGRISTDDIFTEDQEAQRQIIEKWMNVGFILELDGAKSTCTFNEQRWPKYSEEEKIGITKMLGSYCARMNTSARPAVTIIGSNSAAILATLGDSGVELH